MSRRNLAVIALVAALIGMAVATWATGGSELYATSISPDGRERLEYYTPPRWQAAISHRRIIPVVARLTSTTTGDTISQSDIFDLGGGSAEVIWRADYVQIGTVAVYHRASHRWELDF